MADTEKTPEQLAQEKAAADKAKAEEKARKDAEKQAAKEKKEADKKAAAEERERVKAEQAAEKERKKAEAAAAREASKMPEQNGVRRPKPEGLCGQAWAIFDDVSKQNGAPASIGEAMEIAKSRGLNEANVRAEYARWRKFYGISGRVEDPRKVAEKEAAAKAKADAKAAAAAEKAAAAKQTAAQPAPATA
jgi:hypothetical protein